MLYEALSVLDSGTTNPVKAYKWYKFLRKSVGTSKSINNQRSDNKDDDKDDGSNHHVPGEAVEVMAVDYMLSAIIKWFRVTALDHKFINFVGIGQILFGIPKVAPSGQITEAKRVCGLLWLLRKQEFDDSK